MDTYTATYTPSGGGSPTTLYTYALTRDLSSRITGKTETVQGTTAVYEYFYDPAGRLTSVKKDSVETDSFVYDSNSNRTSGKINGATFSATYSDQDSLLSIGSRTYSYNRNGDLTQIQWSVGQQSTLSYDALGTLDQITIPSGTLIEYFSDGLDRRVVKKAASVFQWRYIYEDKYRIAALINSSAAIVKEFVYATKVNVPDYMVTSSVKYRIITDHLGSPRLIVNVANGTVVQRMDYTTLGAVTNDTSPNFQPFGFAGGIYDVGTELVHFGARDYDPKATGRWTTKDPIRFDGDDSNLYGYVLNDPVNLIDPTGLIGMPRIFPPEGGTDTGCEGAACARQSDMLKWGGRCLSGACFFAPLPKPVKAACGVVGSYVGNLGKGMGLGCEPPPPNCGQ